MEILPVASPEDPELTWRGRSGEKIAEPDLLQRAEEHEGRDPWWEDGAGSPRGSAEEPARALHAVAPGEELCFRLCFAKMHLLMFD